jgi:Tn3 transposase DDE domain
MGLGRMADVSDIDYQALVSASDNFIRLEPLKEANDLVSNTIAALPIFAYYDIGDAVHSSSDGQKFETRINQILWAQKRRRLLLPRGQSRPRACENHWRERP